MEPDVQEARRASLVALMRVIADEATAEGLTLRELLERLGERAFGAVLFGLALPCCIPLLYVIPQIVAVPMIVFAAQMTAGRREPWLPQRFADRRIDKAGLERMARGAQRFFGWAETIARPRLLFLSRRGVEPAIGAILCVFCVSILTPLPSTNTVPGFGVALTAFGLMERDGALIILGLVIGTVWIAILIFAAIYLGTHAVSVLEFLRGLVAPGS